MEEIRKNKIIGFGSGKNWEEKIWQDFLKNIENSDNKHKISELIDGILSLNEKKLISKRLAALSLIKSGRSYKEIGEALWISPSTISAVKKSALKSTKYQSSRYHDMNKKGEKRKGSKETPPHTILDYWANLPLPSKTYRRYRHK